MKIQVALRSLGYCKCEVTTQHIRARLVTASVGKEHTQMKSTRDYFSHRVDYISAVENFDPTWGQGVYGFHSQLVLA